MACGQAVGGSGDGVAGPLDEETTSFPIDRWGTVTGEVFQRICIVRSGATSFLILSEENGQSFDNWVEMAEEVAGYVGHLQVVWDPTR